MPSKTSSGSAGSFRFSLAYAPQSVLPLPPQIPSSSSTSIPSLHPPSSHTPNPYKCLIVGLPCGQFQGLSSSPKCLTTFPICFSVKVFPIIILLLQALIANIFLTFDGL